MRILHLSDTHGCHRRLRDLPEADVVVHSGDFCMVGSEQEAIDFLNWFCDLPYRHKIFICGNHDDCLYGANIDGLDHNVHYLCNSGIEIEGLKFYGVPMFMGDCITDRQSRNYASIPEDTDILITHSPAYGILDFDDGINYGSEEILERLTALHQLKAHLFGHIHTQHGMDERLPAAENLDERHLAAEALSHVTKIIFSNGAIMNSDYTNLQTPNVIEI